MSVARVELSLVCGGVCIYVSLYEIVCGCMKIFTFVLKASVSANTVLEIAFVI